MKQGLNSKQLLSSGDGSDHKVPSLNQNNGSANKHGISLNIDKLLQLQKQQQAQQKILDASSVSPHVSTGRFQMADGQNEQNYADLDSRMTPELYNVEVGKEGQQELDPLIPHQSTINHQSRISNEKANRNPAHILLYPFKKNLNPSSSDQDLRSRSQQVSQYPVASRNAMFGLQQQFVNKKEALVSQDAHSNQDKSQDKEYPRQNNDIIDYSNIVQANLTLNSTNNQPFNGSLMQQEDPRLEQFNQFRSIDEDSTSRTIVASMSYMNHEIGEQPENKSVSPNTAGKQRCTHVLPNQMSGSMLRPQAATQKFYRQNKTNALVRPFASDQKEEKKDRDFPPTFRQNQNEQDQNYIAGHRIQQKQKSLSQIRQISLGIPNKSSVDRQQSNQNGSKKQHTYFIDVKDIIQVLQGASNLLKRTSLDNITSKTNTTTNQTQPDQNFSAYIQEVAGGDNESAVMLKFIEVKTGIKAQQFLSLNKSDNRVYQVEDSSLLTSVYFNHAKESLCTSLGQMNESITKYVLKKFRGRPGTARIGFSHEKELFNIFYQQIFGVEIFGQIGINNSVRQSEQSQLPRRIMNELWQTIKMFRKVNFSESNSEIDQSGKTLQKQITLTYQQNPASHMIAYLTVRLLLYSRGRALFNSEQKSFPLHKAVFEGNLPMISRLIAGKQEGILFVDKNEIDVCGNSALVLAVRLRNIDAVKILADLYCSAKLNPFPQVLSALEIAKAMKDRKIVEVLMNSVQKVKQHYMEVHKDSIFKVLERLPDFSIDLHFECTSNFIPWMKHLAPNDTYHIYKQGSSLRLDMKFLGYQKMKAIESNISVLFKGRNSGQSEGELLMIDHVHGKVTSIFEDATTAKIEKELDNIMADQDIQKKYRAEKVKIEPECDRKGRIITQQIREYIVQKYSVNSVYTMTKFKLNNNHVEMLTKYKTFEEYLKMMKVDIFALGNPANTSHLSRRDLRQQQNTFQLNDGLDQPQVSSRPQMNHGFAATAEQHQLQQDIEQSLDPGTHLQTLGDFAMDQRLRKDSQFSRCPLHSMAVEDQDQDRSKTQRSFACNCGEKIGSEAANLGLNQVITKSSRRTINANIWLCQDHPLSIETFLPLLQVLSFSSKQIRKLEQAIDRYDLPRDRFPLKAKVPVFMLVEATFQFQSLQFGRQPDEVFKIDEQVIEQKREQMKQHYQFMQNQNKKHLTFQSEEDVRRQNQTLTRLYQQLSLADNQEEQSRDEESLSDGIELAYQQMLSQPDEPVKSSTDSPVKDKERAKQVIVVNEEDKEVERINHMKKQVQAASPGSVKSSMERMTPANEYDIGDSASNTYRGNPPKVTQKQLVNQKPQAVVVNVASPVVVETDKNMKTTRHGLVKTMSQINERHDRHGNASSSEQQESISQFHSQTNEQTSQMHKNKLDANQKLIERLTGRPLQTKQDKSRHTHKVQTSDIGDPEGISLQTAQERKKRRKEQLRLYKLMKTSKLDDKDKRQQQLSKSPADKIAAQTAYENQSENIMDNRLIDQRPDVNETVEKRKLISYNNASLNATSNFVHLNLPERRSEDTDNANANMDSKRSTKVTHPPFSMINVQVGKNQISSKPNQDRILGSAKDNTLKQAGQSTADESSGQSDNYNSIQSISKSVSRRAKLNKSNNSSNNSMSQTNQPEAQGAAQNATPSSFSAQSQGLLSWLGNKAHSALRRRLEDQNHLQTIESEEVQGTEGTTIVNHTENPYANSQSALQSLTSFLSQSRRNPVTAQRQNSQSNSQDKMSLANNAKDYKSLNGSQRKEQKQMSSLRSMLKPSPDHKPMSLTQEERDALTNPNQFMKGIHQYVVNNKNTMSSDQATKSVEMRAKQRGHTTYAAGTTRIQDAGILTPEALLGMSSKGSKHQRFTKKASLANSYLTDLSAKQKLGTPGQQMLNKNDSRQRSASSLQVLLAVKPNGQNFESRRNTTTTKNSNASALLQAKRRTSDVDIVL